jgi:hypothetical protein
MIEALEAIKEQTATEGTQTPSDALGWESYTLADLENYTTPEHHVIAGRGFIRRGAGTLFTGGTGLGKSVACADTAVWLAGGADLFGCIKVHAPVKTLYVQAENDPDTLQRDILSAVKHSGVDRDIVQANLMAEHVWGLNGEAFTDELGARILRHRPDVVLVDPYQSYVAPGDLNGSTAFLEWIKPVQRLMHEHDFALMLVAHTPKPKERDNWNVREMVYLAAGHSAISNWARCSMELTTAAHETDRFRLTFSKNAERTGLVDDYGHTIRQLYVAHSGNIHEPYWTVADNQGEPQQSKYADGIVRLAVDHPSMAYSEIAAQLGCSKATVAKHYPKEVR